MSGFQYPGLPKWPQMRVKGRQVTPEQASEIIRRTDDFFTRGYGGNSRTWNAKVRQIVGMPPDAMETKPADWNAHWEAEDSWREAWSCVETEYVHNSWVSCSFAGGPHGWCSPTGAIYYRDNIGKWPSGEEVEADWTKLAAAFPFLDLEAVLMSGESCEDDTRPLVGFIVKNGTVAPRQPKDHAFLTGDYAWANFGPSMEEQIFKIVRMPAELREVGVPESMIRDWAASSAAKISA